MSVIKRLGAHWHGLRGAGNKLELQRKRIRYKHLAEIQKHMCLWFTSACCTVYKITVPSHLTKWYALARIGCRSPASACPSATCPCTVGYSRSIVKLRFSASPKSHTCTPIPGWSAATCSAIWENAFTKADCGRESKDGKGCCKEGRRGGKSSE